MMTKKKRSPKAFRLGTQVEFRLLHAAEVVGFRWVGFPDGSGLWKYKLSDGHEMVAAALTKA
jgi:hypothetical protein